MKENKKTYRGFMTIFNEEKFKKEYYNDYITVLEWSKDKDFINYPFEQKLYNWIHDINELPKTLCGKTCEFVSLKKGYSKFCKFQCNCMKEYNKEKRKQTCLKKYGVDNYAKTKECKDKTTKTNLEKYGVEYVLQDKETREKSKKTCLEKYGVEFSQQNDIIKEKVKQTNLERYGVDVPAKSKEIQNKMKQTNLERYGVENVFQHGEIRERFMNENYEKYGTKYHINIEKTKETNLMKYGVEWACMRKEARNHSNDSIPNKNFSKILESNNITYDREFPLENYSYDFKIDNTLIEINPTITHNSYLNVFGRTCLEYDYHLKKTNKAIENGFKCIHIWDWDDKDKIINMLKIKNVLYGRKLEIKEISETETNIFLDNYHLQNTCKGQTIRYGLYKDSELVQLMTFGKPRYNKKYEWELLRLCTHKDYIVVGGTEKLFNYFLTMHMPKSIISYCDYSKFSGNVYTKLGFIEFKDFYPSKHWYNVKTKQHITDNLLRQRGFDQLFGTNYGKGSSNEMLMIDNGFFPIYDAGQKTFVFNNSVNN